MADENAPASRGSACEVAVGRCIPAERAWIAAGAAAYIALFHHVAAAALSPVWAYYGLRWRPLDGGAATLLSAFAFAPALWAPSRLTRPSHFAWWTLYLCVYVPSALVPARSVLTAGEALELNAALLAGIAILSASHAFRPRPFRRLVVPPELYWLGVCALTAACCAWTLAVFGSHIRLVGLSAMYDQRLLARSLANESGASYALQVLKCVLAPLFLAHGISRRKPASAAAGLAILIYVFAIAANKSVVFAAIVALLLGWILRRPRPCLGAAAAWGTAAVWAIPLAPPVWSIAPVAHVLGGSVHFRLFALTGLLSGWWVAFFSRNPWTHFGHVRFFGAWASNPYTSTLPLTVGNHFTGSSLVNANASLWADGFASFGYTGLVLVSVAAAAAFWLMDAASLGQDPRFATIALSFQAMNLADGSLFSTLLGNGLALSILLVYLTPHIGDERIVRSGAWSARPAGPAEGPALTS